MTAGDGVALPWVLLRGLSRDSRHWGAFIAELRQVIGAAPLLLLDLPGNGARHRQRSPATVAAMAEDGRAELQRRGVAPPYRVLAMSLGAMVATAWMARHPDEIDAAVLINTSMRPYSRFHERLQPAAYPALLRLALLGSDPRAAEATILRLTSNDTARAQAVLGDWAAWRAAQPVARTNVLRQLVAAARFHAPADAPRARLLLLASTRDRLVDVRCSQRLAAAWGCALLEHATAGHDLPLDDPRWVAERIAAWLR